MNARHLTAAVKQWAAANDGELNALQVGELLAGLEALEASTLELRDEAERDAARVALASAAYAASDEARALRRQKDNANDAGSIRALEHGLQQAELRRMRYMQLHDRLLAGVS